MSSEERTQPVESLPAELFPFQLIDLRLYEIEVKRHKPDEAMPEVDLSVRLHTSDKSLDVEQFGLLLTFETVIYEDDKPEWHVYLALEGRFQAIVDVSTIRPEVIESFRSSDSIVLFWPYLRQTLHDITGRMRLPVPPLPILNARTLLSSLPDDNLEDNALPDQ